LLIEVEHIDVNLFLSTFNANKIQNWREWDEDEYYQNEYENKQHSLVITGDFIIESFEPFEEEQLGGGELHAISLEGVKWRGGRHRSDIRVFNKEGTEC